MTVITLLEMLSILNQNHMYNHKESEKGRNSWKQNWSKSEPVTMKMIDFAHSTFEGFMDDPIIHEGPDSGYIKGLDSLISILQNASLYSTTSGCSSEF